MLYCIVRSANLPLRGGVGPPQGGRRLLGKKTNANNIANTTIMTTTTTTTNITTNNANRTANNIANDIANHIANNVASPQGGRRLLVDRVGPQEGLVCCSI